MEQHGVPDMVHVSESMHSLLGEDEYNWEQPRTVGIKNMGTVNTWLHPSFATD